jgi:hypothetical protein
MAIKYTKNVRYKTLQNLPKVGFWFENIPSGNPGQDVSLIIGYAYIEGTLSLHTIPKSMGNV